MLSEAHTFLETQQTAHPFQLPEWGSGTDSYYFVVRESGQIRAFARCDTLWPLGKGLDRIRALALTRGPVCDDRALMQQSLLLLAELCRSHRYAYLDVNPDYANADAHELGSWLTGNRWFPVGSPRVSLRVDLRPEVEIIRASFRKTTRAEIRRAGESGVEISEGHDEESREKFLRLYRSMAREKQFAPDQDAHMRQVLSWMATSPKRGVLLCASFEGELLGGVVALRAASRSWYVWGATKKHAAVNVGHLLQWEAMKWAKRQGCLEYDLGGYREGATDGPALFKRGFSETVVRFLPVFRFVTDSLRYPLVRLASNSVSRARMALSTISRKSVRLRTAQ